MKIESDNSLERAKKQINEKNVNSSENEILHQKVNSLLEVKIILFFPKLYKINQNLKQENSKLRDTPDVQRLEEELVQLKMREAEAQLAIKELQKTIHVLNLEYQVLISLILIWNFTIKFLVINN